MSPLDPDRALPADPTTRAIAREIYAVTAGLPIVSMHGHVDANLFVRNDPFPDPAELFIRPDHYLTRMLGSQGIGRAELGLPEDPTALLPDPRRTWRLFCENWRLYRATPTRYWLEHILGEVFGTETRPSAETADDLYDELAAALARPEFRPIALLERFRIETLATTDGAADDLAAHAKLAATDLPALVIPTFRPDALFAVSGAAWRAGLGRLEAAVGREIGDVAGLLEALRERRQFFVDAGARATDHGALAADTTPLDEPSASAIFARALAGEATAADDAAFTAHMLFEMARMSTEDGLTMQFHPGALRDYSADVRARWGADVGYDIPVATEYTRGLRPLLEAFGHHPGFTFVVFTLDETSFSRELAPLAGVFPAMRLGAPWWLLDTPGGMRRFREAVTDNGGFYNTSGFVDDTRAFCSIPARHDLARRVDAGHLAQLVAEGRLPLDEAAETAVDLAYNLPRETYPALTADA
ncbi:MAG TPA: glucuronate isomerase [Arachnia sp.]|nr:glucuronate isomerase [Arachnia sp.]HMT86042.1 glucuronate isomerase [Arachnia sp.]